MKLNLYIFRNATLECSGNPIFDDHEPEVFAAQLERKIMVEKPENNIQFTNASLYHLGSYDDETMRFDLLKDPKLLLDCNLALEKKKVKLAILAELQKKTQEEKEVSKDGDKN